MSQIIEPSYRFAGVGKPIEGGKGHEFSSGRRKITVKVVDIFGNDTMKIME